MKFPFYKNEITGRTKMLNPKVVEALGPVMHEIEKDTWKKFEFGGWVRVNQVENSPEAEKILIAEKDAAEEASEFDGATLKELQDMAASMELSTRGSKADLIEKITEKRKDSN